MSSSVSKKLRDLKDYRKTTLSPELKDEIIVEYAPFIKYIARKIAARLPNNIELDDLISCGVIGLMDAIEKFDPNRDNKFKTYAEFRIRGAILDELRAQDWVPRSIRDKAKLLERTYIKLEAELKRPATDEEMCEALNCTQDEFHAMLNQSKPISLLNIDDSDAFRLSDKKIMAGMTDNNDYSINPFNAADGKGIRDKIKDGIKSLPEKQRFVLSLYYYEDLSLREIGKILNVTESRISQLHTKALMRLKLKLKLSFEQLEDLIS